MGYNRIILIGNGFDLAAGMKTSYSDFVLHLHKKILLNRISPKLNSEDSKFIQIEEFYSSDYNREENEKLKLEIDSITDLKSLIKRCSGHLQFEYTNEFLKSLFLNHYNNWVDIEGFYFRTLKNYLYKVQAALSDHEFGPALSIIKANEAMSYLESELNEYIWLQHCEFDLNVKKCSLTGLFRKLYEPLVYFDEDQKNFLHKIHGSDIALKKGPENVLFLNFNYTNTIAKFRNGIQHTRDFDEIQIHGRVNDDKSPIIFGYGDDTSALYEQLELMDKKELLERIKSFQYHKTYNYSKLLSFLEMGRYEVFIVGHSCGLSDKTMLETIFEQDYCMLVKNFHHGETDRIREENETKKRIAISRHFSNKKKMRKVLVPFDSWGYIPAFEEY